MTLRRITYSLCHVLRRTVAALILLACLPGAALAQVESLLPGFLEELAPADIMPDADGFGPVREDTPVAPVLKAGETVGWAFLTSDFVPTTGYSGKPIHVVAGVSPDAIITGVRLVKHSEPIVLVGIPEARIREVTEGYAGIRPESRALTTHTAEDIDIVSGATVTVMVIDDSILRAGIKVAQVLGLGGMAAPEATGPTRIIDREAGEVTDWETLGRQRCAAPLHAGRGHRQRRFCRVE